MKKVLLTIISVCLIAASIFGLFAGVSSFSDIMNVKEYKEEDAKEGLDAIKELNAGLDLLQENEGTYLAGCGHLHCRSDRHYSEGKSQLSAGYAAYYAGKKQLEEGKAAYAAGKKQIADNTQAYNEGKATLAKIEPLMPYVNQYVEFRDGTIANLAGFSNAQAWFVSVVRPIAAKQGLNIPADVTDLPAYVQQMVADGKAQLKQYEDGLVQLAEAEKPSPQARLSSETLRSSSRRAKTISRPAATSSPTARSSSTPSRTAVHRSPPAVSSCSPSPLT